jgi:hypothetical protein
VVCGVSRKKEIIEVLKSVRERRWNLRPSSSKSFANGHLPFHISIFLVFLDLFFLLGVFLVYFLCTWVAPFRFLINFDYKSKK